MKKKIRSPEIRSLDPHSTFQAGFSYAYNARLYNLTYFPDFDVGTWLSLVSIFGGSFGVVLGGVISDAIVVRIGVHARLWLLGVFMVIWHCWINYNEGDQ
jgi:hypothetical protein